MDMSYTQTCGVGGTKVNLDQRCSGWSKMYQPNRRILAKKYLENIRNERFAPYRESDVKLFCCQVVD